MKFLTIGFSTNKKSKTSAIIRWYLKTKFSHTYLYFKLEEFDQYTVFQAVGEGGAQFISADTFLAHNTVVSEFKIPLSEEQYKIVLNRCHELSGDSYGFLQNIGMVLARMFRLKKNPFRKHRNCSEIIAECIIKIDSKAFKKDLNLITPKDIYTYLQRNYHDGKIS